MASSWAPNSEDCLNRLASQPSIRSVAAART